MDPQFSFALVGLDHLGPKYSKRKLKMMFRRSIDKEFRYETPQMSKKEVNKLIKNYLESLITGVMKSTYYRNTAPRFVR